MTMIDKYIIEKRIFFNLTRNIFCIISVILFLVTVNNIYASQNDIYGTWVGILKPNPSFSERVVYTISSTAIVAEITAISTADNSETLLNLSTAHIISWNEVVNSDINTNIDFPTGYILVVDEGGTFETVFYISRDRNQLIFPVLRNDTIPVIFLRQ